MRTFKVTWACNTCCCISVSVTVETMTQRESEREHVIGMAKHKMNVCRINGDWFDAIDCSVVEVTT
jgi:hypothetical protein